MVRRRQSGGRCRTRSACSASRATAGRTRRQPRVVLVAVKLAIPGRIPPAGSAGSAMWSRCSTRSSGSNVGAAGASRSAINPSTQCLPELSVVLGHDHRAECGADPRIHRDGLGQIGGVGHCGPGKGELVRGLRCGRGVHVECASKESLCAAHGPSPPRDPASPTPPTRRRARTRPVRPSATPPVGPPAGWRGPGRAPMSRASCHSVPTRRSVARRTRLAVPPAQLVQTGEVGDPVEPWSRPGVGCDAGEPPVGLDVRPVQHPLHADPIFQEVKRQLPQDGVVVLDRRGEGPVVAGGRPADHVHPDIADRCRCEPRGSRRLAVRLRGGPGGRAGGRVGVHAGRPTGRPIRRPVCIRGAPRPLSALRIDHPGPGTPLPRWRLEDGHITTTVPPARPASLATDCVAKVAVCEDCRPW